jgi:two-component system sensor histidine kinase KdpD
MATDADILGWVIPLWARQQWRKYARNPRWEPWIGCLIGLILVGAASVLIEVIGPDRRITDNAIVYVLVVVIVAAVFGRSAAIATAFMALLVYDFFFVPPRRIFTIAASQEMLALGVSIAMALITGQLAASLRARAQQAQQREHESRILARLVQVLATCDSLDAGLQQALELIIEVFHHAGLMFGVVILPAADGALRVAALAAAPGVAIERDAFLTVDMRAQVRLAMRMAQPVGYAPTHAAADSALRVLLPLRSGGRGPVIGVVGLGGTPYLHRLVTPAASATSLPRRLIAAFTGQISLAVERDRLRQEAVHVAALRESDQMKTALLGAVTHDLRTPLASIKVTTTSLLEPGTRWDEAEHHALLQNIDEAADRLNRLVGNLLELSRLEAGGLRPCKEWQDIGDVIATTLDQLEAARLTARHTIQVDIAPDLPPVLLDYGQIEQVLANLLINACKYAPPGSAITVTARMDSNGAIETRVHDRGIGIAAAFHEAIFEKFYRAPQPQPEWTETWTFEGTGLGLAICKGIIEMHEGRIWVESAPGQGATFIFTLPVTRDGRQPAISMPAGMLTTPFGH